MSRFVGFEEYDMVAVINDAAGGGVSTDPLAPKNAAAINPVAHLDKVCFHSDFFYYDLVAAPQTVGVNHAALAAASTIVGVQGLTFPGSSPNGVYITVNGQSETRDHVLYTHNLGYVPRYKVSYNGVVLCGGLIVHTSADGGRMVLSYATTSVVGLTEIAVSGATDLPAVSRNYDVYVFNTAQADPAQELCYDDGDAVVLAKGKLRSDRFCLRSALAQESKIDIDLEPTLDNNDGGFRVVTGGVTIDDHLYSGGFAGPDYVPVKA